MIKKKVCMVGEFSVGKTSLTQKFVNNVFSETYLTTIGVKIDTVQIEDTKLVIWDIAGRDSLSPINASYLVGAAGVVLVADGTRLQTVESISEIWSTVREKIGEVPCVVALNKADLEDWCVDNTTIESLRDRGWDVFETSAKDGVMVESLFHKIVEKTKE
ncbi:MAG: GTP-binding protein [Gammaproteobacteria bacterium]|nr:GTP-binding protein [Gammaproteobacteria bacterium]